MPRFRIREAAELLGVSDDSVRRWIVDGSLSANQDESGRKVIAGHVLAELATSTQVGCPLIHLAWAARRATASSAWLPKL